MNLAFLGDALDHWKGSLFESLRVSKAVREFAVDCMASDGSQWTPEDFALFARLLRIKAAQIIPHKWDLAHREKYFSEIRHCGDLFLDPDTGVATGSVRDRQKYVMPSEIWQLLDREPERLVIVYQHVRAQRVSTRVDQVLAAMRRKTTRLGWASYESGTVAMLFFAGQADRATAVANHFRCVLGRHAKGRIRCEANV